MQAAGIRTAGSQKQYQWSPGARSGGPQSFKCSPGTRSGPMYHLGPSERSDTDGDNKRPTQSDRQRPQRPLSSSGGQERACPVSASEQSSIADDKHSPMIQRL